MFRGFIVVHLISVFYKILYPRDKTQTFNTDINTALVTLNVPDGIIYRTLTEILVINGSYTGHAELSVSTELGDNWQWLDKIGLGWLLDVTSILKLAPVIAFLATWDNLATEKQNENDIRLLITGKLIEQGLHASHASKFA